MKKLLLFLFMLVTTTTIAQNKDYLLSLDGIGSLKLGMPFVELEKVLNSKIIIKVINVDHVVLV